MVDTTTLAGLAGEAYDQFERKSRDNGDAFYSLKDGAPEWLEDLVRAAHGDMFPDDWRYDCIHSALGAIHDADVETRDDAEDLDHEFADGHADVYNAARFEWLASHLQRQFYCDEAMGEFGSFDSVTDIIGAGQYMEAREVFALVLDALDERRDEIEDES